MSSSKPTPRQCRPRSRAFHRTTVTLRCISVLDWVHRLGTRICCRDRRWPCSWLRHSRRRNRDNHRSGSSPVCRVHWHIGIGLRGMAGNLKKKVKKTVLSRTVADRGVRETHCKRLRLSCRHNRSCDYTSARSQYSVRRWHIGTDPVDTKCPCSSPRPCRFGSRSSRRTSSR